MKLTIKNLSTTTSSGIALLKGVDLTLKSGELAVIVGPNGSGKSTLAYTIMGHPEYSIVSGEIALGATDITSLAPEKKAELGLFLGFQSPEEIEGISFIEIMRLVVNKKRPADQQLSSIAFRELTNELAKRVRIKDFKPSRDLNVGFSGGEKKKIEILQMLLLEPEVIILDEPDSGLDIDSIDTLAQTINTLKSNKKSIIVISHHKELLSKIHIDSVYVLKEKHISARHTPDILESLYRHGFEDIS